MLPYLCEIAGDLERFRHLGLVGNGERDMGGAKQIKPYRHEPRLVPELERKAHVLRQHGDEMLQPLQVEVEVRLELEEDWAQFFAEAECRVDDQVDRPLLDGEPLDVGDVAAALDGKEVTSLRQLSPGFKTVARWLPVEPVGDIDRVGALRVECEVLTCR